MVNFFEQQPIEAVLLSTALGVIGWALREWWKARRRPNDLPEGKNFSPKHQLPSLPRNFTGRDGELAKLEIELSSGRAVSATTPPKHIALQGIGGVGKTALATALAHKLKKRFPDAQLCLDLHGAKSERYSPVKPADAMQSIIRAFRPEANLSDQLDKLIPIYNGILNDAGRVLLFLDNAVDAEQVKPLQPPANCLMLVTSRTHLPLPGIITYNIDCLRPEKSEELLLKLAPRVKGYEKEVAELCGHLPLALEVFAGVIERNKLYSVPDLTERLRKQPGEITQADATFQVSYNLLSNELARCLRFLAIFPIDFNLAAATAVWELPQDVATDNMQNLMFSGLVESNEAIGRFRLHNLIRQFCDNKFDEIERASAKLRCARFFQAVCSEISRLYENGGQETLRSLELFDRERTNIEMAFEWLQRQKDKESATLLVAMSDIMRDIGILRFYPRKRIELLESQLRASKLINDRKGECKSVGNLGVAQLDSGNVHRAMDCFHQALEISREIGYSRGVSAALGNLGMCHRHLGEYDEAIRLYEEALQIDRSNGLRKEEGGALNNLGETNAAMGKVDQALKQLDDALAISKEIGSKRLEGVVLTNLGITYALLDNIHKAIKYYEQSLIVAREIRDHGLEGFVLMKRAK